MDHLWAGWRTQYVNAADRRAGEECVFCHLFESDLSADETNIVWRSEQIVVILNAFPYGTGHVLVMPRRHVAELHELSAGESTALWDAVNAAATAARQAYRPDGLNIGFNLGEGSGAGIPGHLHAHVLPRWRSDTNFMTSVANAKVLPEALDVTRRKLADAWPHHGGGTTEEQATPAT